MISGLGKKFCKIRLADRNDWVQAWLNSYGMRRYILMKLNGAQIVIESLKKENVDVVFGYPGGTILNIYDALYEYKDMFRSFQRR